MLGLLPSTVSPCGTAGGLLGPLIKIEGFFGKPGGDGSASLFSAALGGLGGVGSMLPATK